MGAAMLLVTALVVLLLAAAGSSLRADLRRYAAIRRLRVACTRDGAPAVVLAEPLATPDAPVCRAQGWVVRRCSLWLRPDECDGPCLDGPVEELESG